VKRPESEERRRQREPESVTSPKWQKWGPYVSERAWGTVREDYSANGDAWEYFSHDDALSKAYRWGEDGIAGWCDRYQVLVMAPAFWNGCDEILKERLFGLSCKEGNHGEDVKEYSYYLDGTPTHSYMKYLYKYPQKAFPYHMLREENRKRGASEREFELVDTGVFQENRYFDVFIEYAKASPEDTCIRIEACNRSGQEAPLHILPHLWFRNQWSWEKALAPKPLIQSGPSPPGTLCLLADDSEMPSPRSLAFDYHLGKRYLYGPEGGETRFTENESGKKDAFHRQVIWGEEPTALSGTKACFHYVFSVPPERSVVLRLRLTHQAMKDPLADVDAVVAERRREADLFYEEVHPAQASLLEKQIQRQALAGVLWNKQIYLFDVEKWLSEGPEERVQVRNKHWRHLNSMRILIMPDKWEYPWFAAWDQAFHCVSLGLVDRELAKEQLWLLLFDQFQHPNGQIPACEWEFSDLNPPVQSWAALKLWNGDRAFLERCFHKLLINFAWWINKVDSSGNNVFEGGFLGLDNITVLDRSQKLPGGVKLQQSDGTGWMAMFCLNLMRIALELSKENKVYESLATKFFEHYVYIAHAMKKRGNQDYEMWSDRDGFFYDVLTYPDGTFAKFRVRSLVGVIPLYAVEILHEETLKEFPEFRRNFEWFLNNRKDLTASCVIQTEREGKKCYVLALMHKKQLESVLRYIWDPGEFRSSYGLRSLSKFHEKHPFVFQGKRVGYEPAESLEKVKGGNSNWRGPVWMPTAFLLIDSLKRLSQAFREEILIQVRGEEAVHVETMARSFVDRLLSLWLPNAEGYRPFLGPSFPYKGDPHWRDLLLFHEYFHPETGEGLGASHQTGWTALAANLIDEFR
jgi:hypothetical protein